MWHKRIYTDYGNAKLVIIIDYQNHFIMTYTIIKPMTNKNQEVKQSASLTTQNAICWNLNHLAIICFRMWIITNGSKYPLE